MVVKTAPSAPLIIAEAEFLLQLLIIALDPPCNLAKSTKASKVMSSGLSGKPILGRLAFSFRPLDQQPFFGAQLAQFVIAMRRPHTLPCKAR